MNSAAMSKETKTSLSASRESRKCLTMFFVSLAIVASGSSSTIPAKVFPRCCRLISASILPVVGLPFCVLSGDHKSEQVVVKQQIYQIAIILLEVILILFNRINVLLNWSSSASGASLAFR